MALTEKKKAFAIALSEGLSNKDAALAAGYSEASAGMKGSQLAKDPDVNAYLANLKNQGGGGFSSDSLPLVRSADDAERKKLDSIDDPLEGLKYIWKNPNIEMKHRIDALKAALPYHHGKVGDIGKKQSQDDQASDIADTDGDFATRSGRTSNSQLMS